MFHTSFYAFWCAVQVGKWMHNSEGEVTAVPWYSLPVPWAKESCDKKTSFIFLAVVPPSFVPVEKFNVEVLIHSQYKISPIPVKVGTELGSDSHV